MSIRNISRLVISAQSRFFVARSFSSAAVNPEKLIRPSEDQDQPIDIANPFKKEKIECILCKHNIEADYKNTRLLSQFQSPYTGRIYGRHITGLCQTQQAKVEQEIRRAQQLGLMPFYFKEITYVKDPKLYDPERPIRPHKY